MKMSTNMRMKGALLLVSCLLMVRCASAQFWQELFQQKKTQIEYLTQQIVALQTDIGYVEKGYHIAQAGLTTISEIKNGEFNLHSAFFGSLEAINPAIAKDARIAEIIALQVDIVSRYKSCYHQVQQRGRFTSEEVNYVYTVFTLLLSNCANDITDLVNVTTAGRLQLTDAERISRIGALYGDMEDKDGFARDFSNQASVLALSRAKDQNDATVMNSLYGITQ